MKIIHCDSHYAIQDYEIKRDDVLRAKLKNLVLIGQTNDNEYTLSDNNIGYVYDLNDLSATHFYNQEFDILIANHDEVLQICLNTITPYLTEWEGEFLVNAIIEIPYTIEQIKVVDDIIEGDEDDVTYDIEDASVTIHDKAATIIKLKPETLY